MKVVVLCAGYATRLYPLTKDRPKPLLHVADRPIIEYILIESKKLREVDSIYIVTNSKFTHVFEKWKKNFSFAIPIEIINDQTVSNDDRLGAIGDLHYAIAEKHIDDDVLVVAGDNLFDLNINNFFSFAETKKPYVTIAAFDIKDTERAKRYGLVELNDEQQVINFREKPQLPSTTLVSLGLYYFPQNTLPLLKKYMSEGNNLDQPGHYITWLANTYKVFAYTFDGSWFDIGDFESLQQADTFYRNKKK
ncbi:MAG: nucleotidyltransferase family protein [Candidatus Omnitrophica bacterium]|nr:nucleotidyltransferase family protein [Candidatus Omnitrophota bacterium]